MEETTGPMAHAAEVRASIRVRRSPGPIGGGNPGGTAGPEDNVREFVAVNDQSELSLLREVAADFGLTVEDVRPRDLGVVTAVFLIGAAALVRSAVQAFADRRRGGQIIDLRPGRVLTRRDRNLLFGLVIVVAEDGEAEI